MPFWKRDAAPDRAGTIAGFWSWWVTARDRVAASIESGAADSLVDELSQAVRRIHPKLAWELAPGRDARHALIVSAEGDLAVRPAALEWRAAAPEPDATWEYHASRQPGPLGQLRVGATDVDLAGFRAITTWDENRERVGVRLWHPALAGAPEQVRGQVAFLFLDNLLGEDDVERWVGAIDALDAPLEGRTPDELRDEIRRRAAEATGESWVLASREDGRNRALIMVNAAIKPIDHAASSHHLTVTVERGLDQLAESGEAPELDEAEDRLVEALAVDGVVHVGHVTENRRRIIHFMCADPTSARAAADAWAAEQRRFGPRVDVSHDPQWAFRRELGL